MTHVPSLHRLIAVFLLVFTLSPFLFSRQPTIRAEDLERKKEGWFPLGLPFANGNTDFGFGAGGGLYLFYNGLRTNASGEPDPRFERWPYEIRIGFQLYFTTLGQQKHFLNLDVPRLGSDRTSLWVEAAWWTTLAENYFGIGGNTPGAVATPGFQQVTTETPYLTARLITDLIGDLSLVTSFKIRHATIRSRSNAVRDDGIVIGTTLFDLQKPIGLQGGWANQVTVGLQWDRRDFAPWPTRGSLVQLTYDGYPPYFSEHVFGRVNLEACGFLSLLPVLVLCGRVQASEILGDAPFWEYARIGGNDRLRGFVDRRFIDRAMVLANLELRFRALQWRIAREQFHLALVPFVDAGQVAPSLTASSMWQPWHLSSGLETILTWNLATHLNITAGFSEEGFAFALDTRVMF